ncbi:alpha/beta hydrolase [Neobacillus mesonae]|nr:alpha/beta hydrolase [Neobacillus mesonae]
MWWIIIVLLVLIAIVVTAVSHFYKMAVKRAPKAFLMENAEQAAGDQAVSSGPDYAWIRSKKPEELEITSFDGLKLKATWIEAESKTNQTVILAHGYTGRGYDMSAFAKFYVEELGFNVLMPDDRGHGASEGNYISFGWHDRLDYIDWMQVVIMRKGLDCEVILHGISMGAATVLMASGEKLPTQVKAIIADCGYTSVQAELTYQLKQMFKLPAFPFIPLTSLYTKLKSGYSFKEASALEQVKRTQLPILYIHGEEDKFVPTSMVYELHEQSGGDKYLFTVPNAAHGTAFIVDPDGYKLAVQEFLGNYLEQNQKVS